MLEYQPPSQGLPAAWQLRSRTYGGRGIPRPHVLFLLPCGFSETAKLAATVSSSPFLRRVLGVASHFDELPLESCHTPGLSQSPGGIITHAYVRVKQDKIQHEYRISRSWAAPFLQQ